MQILILFTLFFSIFTPKFANFCNFSPKNVNLDNFFPKKSAILDNFPLLKVKTWENFFVVRGKNRFFCQNIHLCPEDIPSNQFSFISKVFNTSVPIKWNMWDCEMRASVSNIQHNMNKSRSWGQDLKFHGSKNQKLVVHL